MLAISFDASYAFDLRNRLGTVADAAALSAAREVFRGNSTQANLQAFVNYEIGIASDTTAKRIQSNAVTSTVRLCNAAGATCAARFISPKYVEVILSQPSTSFFGGVMPVSLVPAARAVAGTSNGTACIVTFSNISWGNGNTVT